MPKIFCPWIACIFNDSNAPASHGICQADEITLELMDVRRWQINNDFWDIPHGDMEYKKIHEEDAAETVDIDEVMGCQTYQPKRVKSPLNK